MRQALLFLTFLSLILIPILVIIKVEEPVITQHMIINADLNSVSVEEMPVQAFTLTVKTKNLAMTNFGRLWFVLLPVEPSGLDKWGLSSYNGLSAQDADLSGSIITNAFRVESEQVLTARTYLPEETSIQIRLSREYLQIYVKMPFSEDFSYTTLETRQVTEETMEDKLHLFYWTPAVVEGIYKDYVGEVELPPVPWGTTSFLVPIESLEGIDGALALLFVPMPTAGYLHGELDPRVKANLLFRDIQRIPRSFQLGTVFHVGKLASPVEIHPTSDVALEGELDIEFPDGRQITTEVDDKTDITLLDGTLTIDEKAQLRLEGTASHLTLEGKFGEVDVLTRRVSLFSSLPLILQIIIPIFVGLFLGERLFHRRRSAAEDK